MAHWSTPKWITKSRIATKNRCSETDGSGTDQAYWWFRHWLSILVILEAMVAIATVDTASYSQDDDSQETLINLNRLYLEAMGGEKRWCLYSLISQASTLYLDSFSSSATSCKTTMVIDRVADKRIRALEEEVSHKRENQERILQQHVEEEVMRIRQQSGAISIYARRDEAYDETDGVIIPPF
ncbi:hypothetical protein GH714_025315 [Hevea brasiliensis]|uniref:Uncharacterized protein n=1 Tax=Hevea brasiliensis TaxID=3981 RepID=A0A6A6LDN8_HEVBR|nr:hypothetical protein GH714_025292 [Hevea brasiliensis]KAF2298698.1 hypothetical protein GH714_025315 [Hevea brasiliensis]